MASIPLKDYAGIVAQQNGLNPDFFLAQIQQESGFNPNATNGSAQGIAQVQTTTAANPGYGITPLSNPYDPYASLDFAAKYDAALLSTTNGDYMAAAAKYGTISTDPNSSVGPGSDAYDNIKNTVDPSSDTTYTDPMGNTTDQTDTDPNTSGAVNTSSGSMIDQIKSWFTDNAQNWLAMLVGLLLIAIGVWSAVK